jgi:dienelactone hydrolase
MRALLLSALCAATLWPTGAARAQVNPAAQGTNLTLTWPSVVGDFFQVEQRSSLTNGTWLPLASNIFAANPGSNTSFTHPGALLSTAKFYRVLQVPAPFTFTWTGTNFTYTDANRTFTGIMLKPPGNGPFPAVIIGHGAGGSATGYSLPKAREMMPWGMVCIGPTLTHAAGGETDPINMGNCPENNARVVACANVLASLAYVDTNRLALFGHSMGAFNTIGSAGVLVGRVRAAAITAGGVIPNGPDNATPTFAEANPVRAPFLMFHCDADPVVPPSRSLAFQQILISNAVPNSRILYSSNSLPQAQWHNIHQNATVNADVITNTFQWFQTHGVLP